MSLTRPGCNTASSLASLRGRREEQGEGRLKQLSGLAAANIQPRRELEIDSLDLSASILGTPTRHRKWASRISKECSPFLLRTSLPSCSSTTTAHLPHGLS